MNSALSVIVITGIAAAGCKTNSDASQASGKAAGSASAGRGRAALSYAVDVMPVEAKKVSYVVTAPGSLDAFEHVQVTARVAGVVDRVVFSEGQQVTKGMSLVVIDSERFALALNSAKAAYDKALATQHDAEAMVARREGASDQHPGLIPGEELATYRTKSLSAKADTAVAIEAVKAAQVNLRDSSVRAPMDGIIQTRTIETGQYVQPGYVMATLLRNDPMLLRFQVEPQDAPRLKAGQIAAFTLRETQRTYRAKLTLVAGSADATTHLVAVTAEVIDEGHKYWLRPGSFCDVTLDLGAERDAPVIPRLAVRATDHGYVSYVIDGDIAHEHRLVLGMNTKDGWVEVRSGLAAGELLAVRGVEALAEGAKVRANRVTAASLALAMGAASAAPSAAPAASTTSDAQGRSHSGKSPGIGSADVPPAAGRAQ